MKQIKFFILHCLKIVVHSLVFIKRIDKDAVKKVKKPRKLLRAMLCWLKELKFKGKYKAIRMQTRKAKTNSSSLFNSHLLAKSSAAYIMMEEAYFPLM